MKFRRLAGTVFFFVIQGWAPAFANGAPLRSEWINQKLGEFRAHPQSFINNRENTSKYNPFTFKAIEIQRKFSRESIDSQNFILEKDFEQHSAKIYKKNGLDLLKNNDLPEDLVDDLKYRRLQEMESQGLMAAELPMTPWSGDFWPLYKGNIAQRYADDEFPNSSNWKVNADYLVEDRIPLDHPENLGNLDYLSPAEKYDLLVGDQNWTLTRAMIRSGEFYYKRDGKVESWMGICHGWAPASFMTARPQHWIELIAGNGLTKLNFYPSDIKALVSLLWAKASPRVRFVGGRCNDKNPSEDPENGHLLKSDCFDTNPGTWHMSVINQIGVSKRSMVMDSSYDYEVWNQPIYAYEYKYFNPLTLESTETLEEALVKKTSFKKDKFLKYRSSDAVSMVGIVMKLTYIDETTPSHQEADSPSSDKLVSVNYFYDLELDDDDKIIGGEWYQRRHPDFLWVPEPDAKPISIGDEDLEDSPGWDSRQPMPADWTQAAQVASERGQSLAAVVRELIRLSSSYGKFVMPRPEI